MSGMYKNPFERRAFAVGAAFFVLIVAGLLTANAAPAVADRFAMSWGVAPTFEVEKKLNEIRIARADKLAALERKKEEEKKKTITRRGISKATIKDHVPSEGKFIGIDLVEMKLSMFEDGVEVGTSTVLSKGKPGSHWETPSGSYTIRTKEETHYSTIGGVYMPYSMQFFGNFFIHGWPTEPNGDPVPIGYSGGCIRLSTPDSERVFAFARAGTPIFIYDTDALPDAPTPPLILGDSAMPEISADAFVVADLDAGEILLEKNADTKLPMGSIAKFMTAIIANESISYDRKIEIGAAPEGTPIHPFTVFPEGERFPLGLVYTPLLIENNDQVALSIANYFGKKPFVRSMNEKAAAISMRNTFFTDPTGNDPQTVSTANDLLLLATHLREKKRFLLNITKTSSKTIESENGTTYTIENDVPFAGEKSFMGGDTALTAETKENGMYLFRLEGAATATTTPLGDEDVRAVAVVMLGSKNGIEDLSALESWLATSVAEGISLKQKTASN